MHTPGPWNWWTSNGLMRLTAGVIGGRDGGVLCAVRRQDGFADIEVSEKDAQLIAAAPDMLAVLQRIGTYPLTRDDELSAESMRRLARTAIAKATGE